MKNIRVLYLFSLIAFSSCSSGFNRDLLEKQLDNSNISFSDSEVAAIRNLKPQLKRPFKMSVFLGTAYNTGRYGYYAGGNEVYFRELVKKELEPAGEELVEEKLLKDFSIISQSDSALTSSSSSTEKLNKLSLLQRSAARYGSDAVLTLSYACQTDRYLNPLSIFYLTLVGMFIFPGNNADSLCLVEANLIDANNGFLYFATEASGEAGIIRPTVYLEVKDSANKALENALKALKPELSKRFRILSNQI